MMSVTYKSKSSNTKKKPPPRPPPPNFSKFKSKSTYTLNKQNENLIEWSPPSSPNTERIHRFGGSVSSSFSSSTSSLASSKKSFEYEPNITNNIWPINNGNGTSQTSSYANKMEQGAGTIHQTSINNSTRNYGSSAFYQTQHTINGKQNGMNFTVPSLFGPTIIRAHPPKKPPKPQLKCQQISPSLPMPRAPPPSPPKNTLEIETPYGVALYDFPATYPGDLSLQAGDVVVLVRRINSEWFYGQLIDKEGIFPCSFIDIKVALKEDECTVTALYDFEPQMTEDLKLRTGQCVKVIKKISDDWLFGESEGKYGQFPSNFVDRIPPNL